jgi:glycosyltransferase involved in cell wall biosynthesis
MPTAVCLFTDSLDPSGLGEHMLTLAAELRSRYDVWLVCPASPSARRLLERGRAMRLDTLELEVRGDPAATDALTNWLVDHRVQVFHDHAGISWEGQHGVEAARRAGVPAVVRTEHLPYLLTDPLQQEAHRRTVQLVDRLICVSRSATDSFAAVGIAPERLRSVRNGIAPRVPTGERSAVLATLGLSPEAQVALTVARLEPQKGHRDLLAAAPSVLARHPRLHLVWVGDGSQAHELRHEVRSRGLDARIHLTGQRTDVPDLMANADVLVQPSLFEGLPLVVLEAMWLGVPILATNVPGIAEAVEDRVTARLVPPRDPRALAATLLEVLDNPAAGAARAAAALSHARSEFSAERMANEVAAIYEEVLLRAA